MCGIFRARLATGSISPAVTRLATNRLAHRGPDEVGTWISKDQDVALGHRRLSIVGLDNGAANRQRGRHSPYRRKRRILRLPSIRQELEARGQPPPHAVGQ